MSISKIIMSVNIWSCAFMFTCFVDKVSRCRYQSKTLAAVGLEPSIFQFKGVNHSTRLQWLVYVKVSSDEYKRYM